MKGILFFFVVVGVASVLMAFSMGEAQSFLGQVATELADAETEIRTGVFPAVAGVFGSLVLIAIAAAVIRVITSRS
jgi:hypothetical protein